MSAPRLARDAGLSLIEVMIAVALLSVALVALIGKVHGCIDTARVTEAQNASREYATELLAEIEAGLVDSLFDGYLGDFADKGYPQLRYVVRLGEGASEATQDATGEEEGELYRATSVAASANPEETDEDVADEPFTRVRVTVEYPLPDGERIGTFTLEKRIATERTEGARGIEEKKQRDAEAAAAGASTPPAGGSSASGSEAGGGPTTGGGASKKP